MDLEQLRNLNGECFEFWKYDQAWLKTLFYHNHVTMCYDIFMLFFTW